MSQIKKYVEENLPVAKAMRFKNEVMAMLLGCSQSRAEQIYYNGSKNVDQLYKLAYFLDCKIDDLFEFDQQELKPLSKFKQFVKL